MRGKLVREEEEEVGGERRQLTNVGALERK